MADQPIQKFDPQSYVEAIRGKIRSAILDVVPEDEWDRMVKAEIESFFHGKPEIKDGYYTRQHAVPALFPEVCRKVLAEEAQKQIKALLDSPEWTSRWAGQRMVAGEQIQQFMRDNAGEIISSWLSGAFQILLSQLRAQLTIR